MSDQTELPEELEALIESAIDEAVKYAIGRGSPSKASNAYADLRTYLAKQLRLAGDVA
jgi:hypothetical protein